MTDIRSIFEFGFTGLAIEIISFLLFSLLIYFGTKIFISLIVINVFGFSVKYFFYNIIFNNSKNDRKFNKRTFIQYISFYIVAYFANLIILESFVSVFDYNIYITQLLYIVLFGVLSYFLTRYIFINTN